ncbi:MAG: response regulator [bacterium]
MAAGTTGTGDTDARRVLVVAADLDLLTALEAFISMAFKGLDVATATETKEAMRILDAWPAQVVVAQHDIPEVQGAQFLRWARQRRPDIRCVLVAAPHDAPAGRKAAPAGIPVLVTPFTPQAFVDLLDVIGDELQ